MPLEIVFLEPQNWRPLKPHYYIPITAFSSNLPGKFALKNAGLFWWFCFFWSPSASNKMKHENSSKNFSEKSEQNSAQTSGRNFEKKKSGNFCFKVPEGHHPRGTTLREALSWPALQKAFVDFSSNFQKGRKGAGVKGAGVANCRIFRSAVPSVVVWSILLVSLSGVKKKVMTIYDAGPLAAGPLCGLLTLAWEVCIEKRRVFFGDLFLLVSVRFLTWPQLGPFFVPACLPLTAINGY